MVVLCGTVVATVPDARCGALFWRRRLIISSSVSLLCPSIRPTTVSLPDEEYILNALILVLRGQRRLHGLYVSPLYNVLALVRHISRPLQSIDIHNACINVIWRKSCIHVSNRASFDVKLLFAARKNLGVSRFSQRCPLPLRRLPSCHNYCCDYGPRSSKRSFSLKATGHHGDF